MNSELFMDITCSIILSIREKWVDKIAKGEKTIEVRKTIPKSYDKPFRCYIYSSGRVKKVVGEFICDELIDYWPGYAGQEGNSCLTFAQELEYLGDNGHGYGLHISDLIMYDEPMELKEFYNPNTKEFIKKAPQSWCYCVLF